MSDNRDRKPLNIEGSPNRRGRSSKEPSKNWCGRCCAGIGEFLAGMVWKNFGQVVIMALGFLILSTSYHVCENLSTSILKGAGLVWMSKTTLTILSLSSALASFFMTPMV